MLLMPPGKCGAEILKRSQRVVAKTVDITTKFGTRRNAVLYETKLALDTRMGLLLLIKGV